MLHTLIAPILSHIPALLAPASRAIVPGEDGALLTQLNELEAQLPEALTGAAGTAIAQSIHTAAGQVEQTTAAGTELDLLEEQARQAVAGCAAEIADIATTCQLELVQAAALTLATGPVGSSPAVLMATLAPIAAQHLAAAKAELAALEAELDGLAAEVRNVPIPEQTQEAPATDPTIGSSGAKTVSNPGQGTPQAQAAVAAAKSALGTPYQWGGNTPGVGLDCSGLTQWAYAQAGVDIPRTADAQAVGAQITRDQLQPGDLAVWDGHVAMIVDDGHFIEAGDPVQISPIRETNIGMNFKGYYRPTAN